MYRVMVRRRPGPDYPQLDPWITVERKSFEAAAGLARLFDHFKAEVVVSAKLDMYGMLSWEQLPHQCWIDEEELE